MTRHKLCTTDFLDCGPWVMTLSTVVTTNDVEKYTLLHSEFPENRGSTFLQNVGNHLQQTTGYHNPGHHNQILHNCEEHKHIYTYTMPLWCRELL